jgi:hypothetical protein
MPDAAGRIIARWRHRNGRRGSAINFGAGPMIGDQYTGIGVMARHQQRRGQRFLALRFVAPF